MKNRASYINFPITCMQGALDDFRGAMTKAILYASYRHFRTSLEFGNDLSRFKDALRYFGVDLEYDETTYFEAEYVNESVPVASPMTGVNTQVFQEFYSRSTTNDQKAVFLAFLALKSIIGKKPYCKLTNEYLIARMGGFSSLAGAPTPLPPKLQFWDTRRRLDRIKIELQQNWSVNIYGYRMRGFYASIDARWPREKLIEVAETNRKSRVAKNFQKLNERIRNEVLKRI